MNIAVCIKQVPDTYSTRHLNTNGRVQRDGVELVVDEIDLRAVELAIQIAENLDDSVLTAVCMGPERARDALIDCLGLGMHRGVHICDDRLAGADLNVTSKVLSAALSRENYDLIICGNESTDGRGGCVSTLIAEFMNLPIVTCAEHVTARESDFVITRALEEYRSTVVATVPLVLSVTDKVAEPRFPSFRGIRAARTRPIEILSLDDLFSNASFPAEYSEVLDFSAAPARSRGAVLPSNGRGGVLIADFLDNSRLLF